MKPLFVILLSGSAIFAAWSFWKVQEGRQGRALPPGADAVSRTKKAPRPLGGARDAGFLGVVVAGDTVQLESKEEGRIEALLVKAGDEVDKDAVIATIDSSRLQAELNVQKAAARAAAARLRRRAPLARGGHGAVTPEELDSARFEVVREEDRVKALQRAIAEATVRAPFAGTVTETFLSAGSLAGPGRPIVRLQGRSSPRVRFAVPESAVLTVKAGAPVLLRFEAAKAKVPGTVISLNPQIDPAARMVFGTVEIGKASSEQLQLSTGIVARVFLDHQRSASQQITLVDSKD